jgi:Protein of unknown function (DUF2510)
MLRDAGILLQRPPQATQRRQVADAQISAATPTADRVQAQQPSNTTARAPAGWYPDPARHHQYRWWDGANRTPHAA